MAILPPGVVLPPLNPRAPQEPTGDKPRSGRFPMLNRFVDGTLRRLPKTAALVWFVLYRSARADGTVLTTQSAVAQRIGRTPRTVKSAMRTLRSLGLVQTVKRGRPGRYTLYRIRSVIRGMETTPVMAKGERTNP